MKLDIEYLADQILARDRRALSQAITLIESTRRDHRVLADQLLNNLLPHAGSSIRLGISGAPGVGKSTFIEALGNHVIDVGHRLAVLTVDPSSVISGGSILGDKTRMETLSRRKEAFIRPSPSGKTLGGVARRSRETLILCEVAGYDVVMIETVGVGQSETHVSEMTDMFILLLLPGAGDELQGIKRGIMELADLIIINKADDDLFAHAEKARHEYLNALRLLHPPNSSDWMVNVLTCSARDCNGLVEAWDVILNHFHMLQTSSNLIERRTNQARNWMWSEVNDSLINALMSDDEVREQVPVLESATNRGMISPTTAAQRLMDIFLKRINQQN